MNHTLTALPVLTSLLLAAFPAHAAEDHFQIGGGQYVTGNAGGQNPPVAGWSGAWIKAGGDGDVQLYDLGLNHPGLATSGGRIWAQNGTRSGRLLATPCNDSTTGTVYLSLLLKLDSDHPGRYRCFELHNGGFDDSAHRVLQLGQADFGFDGFSLRVNNDNALRADLGPADLQPNLFVFKFVFSTAANSDSLTVWRNPASLGGAEPAGGTTLSGFNLRFDRTSLASWATPIWETYFAIHADEFRLGSSWASVTPAGGPAEDRLVFDFDDGTMQGWTTIRSNTNYSPQAFEVQLAGDAQAGGHAMKQRLADTWPGFADLAHETIWVRSPEFTLNGAGDLTLWLMGGARNTIGSPPANESQVPFDSVDTANGGFHGVALRNAATGAFVLLGNRNTNGAPEGPLWEQVTFSAAQLAALDQGATYTLDLIDARNNSWAWVNMDSVVIPGDLATGGNQAPTISAIADQSIPKDSSTGPLAFTIADDSTPPESITLTTASSNTALVPAANITLGGSGANRTVTVTPAAGLAGLATITITADDGTATRDRSFLVTVFGDRLTYDFDDGTLQGWSTVTGNPAQQTFAPNTHGPLFDSSPGPQAGSHLVGVLFGYNPPVESPWDAAHATMWVRSPEFTLDGTGDLTAWLTGGSLAWNPGAHPMTNTADVPANSVADNGFMGIALRQAESGNFVAVKGLPADTPFDWVLTTITQAELAPYANDGKSYTLDFIDARHGAWGLQALDSVAIPGALAGNQAPTISLIADQSIPRNGTTGPIPFTVDDDTTDPALVTLGKASSNTTLVPLSGISFGGAGSDRTVTVTPAANLVGTATITLTASDGSATRDRSFLVTVYGQRLNYDFDDGTLQDWTVVSTDPQNRQLFAVQPPPDNSPNAAAQAGPGFLGLHIPAFTMTEPAYTQDSAHGTLWLRSPEFKLTGSGESLTAWLCGGHGYGADATGKLVANVPATAFDDPGNPTFPSFLGIALRNADTGVFVLAGTKTSPGNDWQQVTFPGAQLATLDQDATYTLDLLDVRQGGWGWVNLDSVSIPGTLANPPADPYAYWATVTKGLAGPAAAFDADPDVDGLSNGIEFVLGGEPNPAHPGWNSCGLLPTAEAHGPNLVFSYTRTDDSAYLNQAVEFDADLLAPWTTAVHGVNATVATTPVPGEDAATITVSIPKNGAPRLFARLVIFPPPTP